MKRWLAGSGLLTGAAVMSMGMASADTLPALDGLVIEYDTREVTWPALDLSPDGGTILFDLLGDIYSLAPEGGPARPMMTGAAFDTQPVFSPDGQHIAFVSDRDGRENLWIANADGSAPRPAHAEASGLISFKL